MAPPGPEEQDSLLLQRKSARRCVKQRPSYDIFEDSDDSEPGGPPAPRRRTPRENGANCLLFLLSVLGGGGFQTGACICVIERAAECRDGVWGGQGKWVYKVLSSLSSQV